MPATQAKSSAIATLGRHSAYCPLRSWGGLSRESEAVIHPDHARYAAESSRGEGVDVVDSGHYAYRERTHVVIQAVERNL
jgi:hypothetical protein